MIGILSRRRGWWRLMLLGVILLILGNYVAPVRSYLEKSSVIQREQGVADNLRLERDKLQQEKESLQTNSYMEQVARKDLGMVKPGEQPYVVKDLNPTEVPPAVDNQATDDAPLYDRIVHAIGSLLP
jgi:cell division protein FtsB